MTARWLAVGAALFALAGCKSRPLEAGRYACDPTVTQEALDTAQCPGEWRCGLERYCHAIGDTTVAWTCASDLDCEAGWKCGLSATRDRHECHDPERPDAGLACEVDGDCVAGWRCGVGATCVDPAEDALVPDSPAAIGASDRVSPLLVTEPVTLFSASAVLTGFSSDDRRLLAYVSGGNLHFVDQYVGADLRLGTNPHRYFDVGDAGAVAALSAYGLDAYDRIGPYDEDFTDNPDPRAFLLRPDGGLAEVTVLSDGGIRWQEPMTDYFGNIVTVKANRLKMSDPVPETPPMGLAFNTVPADKYLRFDSSTLWIEEDLSVMSDWTDFAGVPDNEIHDMSAMRPDPGHLCVFAADNRGLFISQVYASNGPSFYAFEPVNIPPFFPNQVCSPPSYRIQALNLKGRDWMAVTAQPLVGGQPDLSSPAEVALIDMRALWPTEGDAGLPSLACSTSGDNCSSVPGDTLPFKVAIGPCEACPVGAPTSVTPVVLESGEGALETRCPLASADGGQTEATFLIRAGKSVFSGACSRESVVGESSLLSDVVVARSSNNGQLGFAGLHGQLWTGAVSSEAQSLTLDRAPVGLVRFTPAGSTAKPIAFTSQLMAWPATGVGFLVHGFQRGDTGRPAAPVQGHADWFLLQNKQVLDLSSVGASGPRTAAFVGAAGPSLAEPTFAATVPTGTGGTALVVSSYDTVYEANVSSLAGGNGPPMTLPSRMAPQPGLPIRSLAGIPPRLGPSGELPRLQAYALVGSRVFELVADPANRWRSNELKLPPSEVPVKVLADRGRARVGFSDGSLYALPSVLPVGVPLAASDQPAVDYVTACGGVFALADTGLFRLTWRSDDPVGTWTPVDLSAGPPAPRFEGGRVHALGDELYLFTAFGETYRVKLSGCPASAQ